MVTFTYVASGSLNLRKCGIGYHVDPLHIHNIAFSIGDQAWIKYKAIKGILEWIIIKKIKIFDYSYNGEGPCTILYVDTFNALYNEEDLIYYEDALALVEAFYERRRLAEAAAECLR